MPLETFDTPDAIPEDARANAIETKDGKFVVFREPPTEDVSGLKKKNAELIASLKEAKQKADEEAKRRAEAELAKAGLLEHKQKWDAEILAPVSERLKALEQENRTLKLVGPIKDALHKAGAVDPEAAWALEGHRFDLDEQGRPFIKDDPTADIAKWVSTELPKARPYLFAATGASGGGAAGAKTGAAAGKGVDPRGWTAIERAEYIEANGLTAFRKLMSEAATKK
jgi:hypothetical protein